MEDLLPIDSFYSYLIGCAGKFYIFGFTCYPGDDFCPVVYGWLKNLVPYWVLFLFYILVLVILSLSTVFERIELLDLEHSCLICDWLFYPLLFDELLKVLIIFSTSGSRNPSK